MPPPPPAVAVKPKAEEGLPLVLDLILEKNPTPAAPPPPTTTGKPVALTG